ncbi:MAG: hypothetical protein Q8Q73_18270, partial [Stagnimonas sp.]|nr:hypothetical protein [Stagnimonas sp.]
MSHHYRKTRLALAVAAFVGGAGQIPPAQAQSQPAQAEFRVNTYTANNQVSPAIAMDAEGDFVVSWQSQFQDGSGFGIYAQRYNAAGTPQGSEFRVNTTTVNSQISPAIAMDADGDFVVSWQSGQIYAQRYNAAGTPQGSEFKVNTTTANSESDPAIAMDADGDFVVSWESSYYEYGSPNGIYAQRYNAAGTPQGSEFKVNTTTANNQSDPAIAMDADGDFVVSWQSSLTDIYVQRYNAAGTPQGSEFKVNTTTANNQVSPAIAMDADSDFVVSWASNSQDGSLYGIYAQRYNAAGTPQG